MLLVRDRACVATLDVGGSLAVLGLTLAITNRVVQAGPVGALGIFRADHVGGAVPRAHRPTGGGRLDRHGGRGCAKELGRGPHARRSGPYTTTTRSFTAFIATMLVDGLADNLGVLWIAMEGTPSRSALLGRFPR